MNAFNPFSERAAAARARAARLAAPSSSDQAMAEHFPHGGGYGYGSRRSRGKRLDASINRAVAAVAAERHARLLEAQARAFEAGDINAQGRSVDPPEVRAERDAQPKAGKVRRAAQIAAAGFDLRKIHQGLYDGEYRLDDGRVVRYEMNFDADPPDGGYRFVLAMPDGRKISSPWSGSIAALQKSGALKKLLLANPVSVLDLV